MMKWMRVRAQTTLALRDDVKEKAFGCVVKNKTHNTRGRTRKKSVARYR